MGGKGSGDYPEAWMGKERKTTENRAVEARGGRPRPPVARTDVGTSFRAVAAPLCLVNTLFLDVEIEK